MELFSYKAIDERGRIHRGRTDATNAADLETRLSRLGLDLIAFRELNARRQRGRAGIRRVDLITFCFHL